MYRCFFSIFIIFSLAIVCFSRAEEPSSNFGLPELSKEVALKKLLEQFSYEDWRDWENSYVARRGTPTIAKYYLERVAQVDKELAQYLEISARLFHRLYFQTRKGEVFNFEAELQRLEPKTTSEIIEQIKSDQIAKSFIENLRYEFILKYVEQNSKSANNLKLLASLSLSEIDQRLYPGLISSIDRLSVKASPRYRKTFFENESLLIAIKKLVDSNLAAKRALANLFLIGAVDGLEQKEKAWAEHLFKQSEEVYPNFALQLEVAKYLELPQIKESETRDKKAKPRNTKFTLFQEKNTKQKTALPSKSLVAKNAIKSSGSSFSFLFIFIMVLAVVSVVIVIILYKRYVEFQRYKIKHRSSASKEDSNNLETIPGLDEFSSAKVSNL